jgi:hypothetical protein
MTIKEEFLRMAARAEQLAQEVKQPHAREKMLQIAHGWRELADRVAIDPASDAGDQRAGGDPFCG